MNTFITSSILLFSISTAAAAHLTPEQQNQTQAMRNYLRETNVPEVSVEKVEEFLKNGAFSNVNLHYKDGDDTLLHELIKCNHKPEVIETFIKYGINIARDINGKTPLHRAFDRANISAAKVLIKHLQKDDFNKKDRYGSTPLHMAIHCSVPEDEIHECLAIMLEKGGNPNEREFDLRK